MAHVLCSGDALRALTGGYDRLEAPGATVRALLAALDARYPGFAEVAGRMAVAIDGELHQDALHEQLAPDAEVVFIPRIGAG